MRIALRVVAVLLIGLGVVWILQGMNMLGGSPMTGHMEWAYGGGFAVLVGLGLLVFSVRSRS